MKATFKQLENGITHIDAEYGLSGIASIYLLEQEGKVAIIETGTNHSVPLVKEVLASKNLSFNDVLYIIPTHVHLDHAGGAGELMHQCKNAQLVIHPYGARHMIDPSKLEAGTIAVYGEEKFKKLYGSIRPIDKNRVIEAPDNFELDFLGRTLLFIDTPGHARHHFCIVDKDSEGVFTGDTFGIAYPMLNTPNGPFIYAATTPIQFDPGSLLESIERILSFKPKRLFLTHFGEITPTAETVKQLQDCIKAFSNIALKLENKTENRADKIRQKVKDYLLETLEQMGSELSREEAEKMLNFDAGLNAQGLDYWLKTIERSA